MAENMLQWSPRGWHNPYLKPILRKLNIKKANDLVEEGDITSINELGSIRS